MAPIILWFVLRFLTSTLAGMISSIKPLVEIEKSISFYPPGTPIDLWFNRAFLSPWMRWDAEWYRRIVIQGYSASDGTAPFHPLYPWLATPFARLGIVPEFSLLFVSALAGIGLFICFYKQPA
jgi:hypothetical protein